MEIFLITIIFCSDFNETFFYILLFHNIEHFLNFLSIINHKCVLIWSVEKKIDIWSLKKSSVLLLTNFVLQMFILSFFLRKQVIYTDFDCVYCNISWNLFAMNINMWPGLLTMNLIYFVTCILVTTKNNILDSLLTLWSFIFMYIV